MKRAVLGLFLISSLFAAEAPKRARNVILLLADAGGVATVNAASIYAYNAPQKLYIQSWEHIGLSDTSPSGKWVTDSAAGMTAIVTGKKTWNGVLSQAPDAVRGQKDGTPLKTILEYAEEKGLSTGILSNVTITDATPAACIAQVNDRGKFGEIFMSMFQPRFGDGVDIVFGPGRQRIFEAVKKLGKDPDAVAAEFKRPVYASMDEVPADVDRAIAILDKPIDLDFAAKRAIQSLSKNPKGYFLMIESDAHTDNPEAGLKRLVSFDKTIRDIAAMVNLDETLLLFTADHSFELRLTGGGPDQPLLKGYEEWRTANAGKKAEVQIPAMRVGGSHTGEEVLVAAKGAGSERVHGYMANTQLFHIMLQAYGWQQ